MHCWIMPWLTYCLRWRIGNILISHILICVIYTVAATFKVDFMFPKKNSLVAR
jgi:hypothetical protein